jgi:hypothetical protein
MPGIFVVSRALGKIVASSYSQVEYVVQGESSQYYDLGLEPLSPLIGQAWNGEIALETLIHHTPCSALMSPDPEMR